MSFLKCVKDAIVSSLAPSTGVSVGGSRLATVMPFDDMRKYSASVASVLPFTDLSRSNAVDSSDESSESESSTPRAGASYRITTRARYTYELRSYAKNAMIILADSEEGRERDVRSRIKLVKQTFEKFRFETDVHVGLSVSEMAEQLEEFFSRDRTKYGAVAVVILAARGAAGVLEARGQRYHEELALRWLTADQPRTLRGKPKIYLTEAHRHGSPAQSGVYSLPITRVYPDIIAVHIPVIIDGHTHPLRKICERLGESDVLEDVNTAVHEAESTFFQLDDRPIQVDNTLQMELRLEM